MARLVYMDPDGRQQALDINAQSPQIVIGRHPDCDLVSGDGSVSRRHCVIACEGGHFSVADLGSANGTQVNDAQVTRRHLVSRDTIRCGNLLLQFFDDAERMSMPVTAVPPLARPPSLPPPAPRRGGFPADRLVDTSAGTSLVALLRADVARLQGRIQQLETANAGQAERLGSLQTELSTAQEHIDAAFGQAAEAESESRALREQLWRAEEQVRTSSAALETALSGQANETAATEATRAATAVEVLTLDARCARLEAERREALMALEAARAAAAPLQDRLAEAEQVAEGARREEAHLRSALNEAREEAKTAGQIRKALGDAQAEIKRLENETADERDAANDVTGGRVVAMEDRLRQTEVALAEAEGRAHEAQTALLKIREAERAARGGVAPDRATTERLNQMTVKLAAVTRRAQLAEAQAESARRLEERTRGLEAEMSALRAQLNEVEGERDHAASTTLVLLAEQRSTSEEVERLRARLGRLDKELTAARAARPDWPAWMDDRFETLGELVRQFRADIAEVAKLWSSLPSDQLPIVGRERFSSAVASARAGADSLVEGTDAAREAIEALRAALLSQARPSAG